MTELPNPFASMSQGFHGARPAACDVRVGPGGAPMEERPSILADEPLPLFLTDAAPEMDRELEAMLRVHFGVTA